MGRCAKKPRLKALFSVFLYDLSCITAYRKKDSKLRLVTLDIVRVCENKNVVLGFTCNFNLGRKYCGNFNKIIIMIIIMIIIIIILS
jgi:hypothetical protein